MTGGLGNQMFIYAFYLRMKKRYPKVRIDLSDMVHYHVHHGYEMHRVFNLPHTEFCINQPLKKVIEFLFFKKIYERKQDPNSLRAFEKKYLWPLLYFKGFYQSERFFADVKDEVRKAFTFDSSKVNARSANCFAGWMPMRMPFRCTSVGATICNRNTGPLRAVSVSFPIIRMP